MSRNMGNSNASGLTSSIVLSSARGIELLDPSYVQRVATGKKGNETYEHWNI